MQVLTHLLPPILSEDVMLAWSDIGEVHSEKILSDEEHQEYLQFKNPARKQEYLSTRALVKDMAAHLGLKASRFELQKDALGKPAGGYKGERYHISIAHTDHRVLSALSKNRELGVDMEPAGRKVPPRLRDRMLNPDEVALVKKLDTVRIWTIKEAIVKLEGKGMRTNLRECPIMEAEGNEFVATFNNDNQAKICSFPYENYWLAIAWNY